VFLSLKCCQTCIFQCSRSVWWKHSHSSTISSSQKWCWWNILQKVLYIFFRYIA